MNLSYKSSTSIDVYFINEVNCQTNTTVDTLAVTCDRERAESYAKSLNEESTRDTNKYVVVQDSMDIKRYRDIQLRKSRVCECIDGTTEREDVLEYLNDYKIKIKGLPEYYKKYKYIVAAYIVGDGEWWYDSGLYLRSEAYSRALHIEHYVGAVFLSEDVEPC